MKNPSNVIIVDGEEKQSLQSLLAQHQEWLKDHSKGKRLVLDGRIFEEGVDLSGVNLSYASLSQTIFSDSSFNGANLNHITATETVFQGVDMRNASFNCAGLQDSIFTNVNCQNACFAEANLFRVKVGDMDITDANFAGACLKLSLLMNIHGSKAMFHFADLAKTIWTSGKLDKVDFRCANFYKATLEPSVTITNSVFHKANLDHARFGGITLYGDYLHDDLTPIQ